jgi:hypothetical protein
MAQKPNLDEPTRRIAERLLNMPPNPHDEMKLGKPGKLAPRQKDRPASKGRVHKGRTLDEHIFTVRFLQRRNHLAICLIVSGLVSRPVRETFALYTLKSNCRTFPVAELARVPFEIPFREIAAQMGFADRMMCAEHGALH